VRAPAVLAVLVVLVAAAFAQDRPRMSPEVRRELIAVIGEDSWRALPPWRQHQVEERYERFRRAPEERRRAIEERGLRAFLVAERRVDVGRLPPPLRDTVEALPPEVRTMAAELAFLRLRQIQFDESLRAIPDLATRWRLFDRRFPRPYDESQAAEAHEELKRHVAQAFAARLAKEAEGLDAAERRALVRRTLEKEQEKTIARIRRELFSFSGRGPDAWRRYLERHAAIEGIRFGTPRQRELIRYAMRPADCPLLDMAFMGERPDDPDERRAWDRDFNTLARLQLLDAAGFSPELALYLAGTGSPADFFRAVEGLREPR
jgi:hypothetical protein